MSPFSSVQRLLIALLLITSCTLHEADNGQPIQALSSFGTKIGHFDYQLDKAYPPQQNVAVVVRDKSELPAIGLYNVCYINGFQTQPNEGNDPHWNDEFELKLKDADGNDVEDDRWKEFVLDIRTQPKRKRLVEIIARWIAKCAQNGFDAVEIDNMDTYLRTDLIQPEHNIAVMRDIIKIAKGMGLDVAQKNALDIANSLEADFVIAERCSKYDICDDYINRFPGRTFIVEYEKRRFEEACRDFGNKALVIHRDVNLKPKGHADHIYQQCEASNPNAPL